MNKEFNAHGRQEREEILSENLSVARKLIKDLTSQNFELKCDKVELQKTIKYLTMSIVVITCVAIYFMFALGL